MLDRIIISRSENKATMIFTDRDPFTLSTDDDIVIFLLWFLDSSSVKLVTFDKQPQLFYAIGEEEITQEISMEKIA
jgi:hypothetical protein